MFGLYDYGGGIVEVQLGAQCGTVYVFGVHKERFAFYQEITQGAPALVGYDVDRWIKDGFDAR